MYAIGERVSQMWGRVADKMRCDFVFVLMRKMDVGDNFSLVDGDAASCR